MSRNERLGITGCDELFRGGESRPLEATPKSAPPATRKDKWIKKMNE